MRDDAWQWDETLFLGAAPYYARGRLPYPPELADTLADALHLDGTGRLIDVGCGPGTIALRIAHLFAEVVGVDPDAGMLAEAEREAAAQGVTSARWVQLRAEDLPADLGRFRVATFSRSFHWMERDRVAAIMLGMLEPGGAFVQVTDAPDDPTEIHDPLPHPAPPLEAMDALVRRYLGPARRAGRGIRNAHPDGETIVLERAGFQPPQIVRFGQRDIVERPIDVIVARLFSASSSAPHLFGDRLAAFERDLRRLLGGATPSGMFSERRPIAELRIWRAPTE
jgi:SAM-dependent methyltransferase